MKRGLHDALVEELLGYGKIPDEQIDLARGALIVSFFRHPGISIGRYEAHLRHMAEYVELRYQELIHAGAKKNLETKLASLKHVLSDRYGYSGDNNVFKDYQGADIISVIDRRKGLSIALSILYIYASRAQGWDVSGVNFPGRFLVRLDHHGERMIFDPFQHCKIMQAQDLRALLKQEIGSGAELSAHYFEAIPNREILIRLNNHIKFRMIEDEDYNAALEIVDAMRLIDPKEYRLLLDAGVLYARNNQPHEAIDVLEEYIKLAPQDRDCHDAALLLHDLKDSLT